MNKKEIGKIIRLKRKGKDLKQKDLAEMIGVDRTAVGKWEKGVSSPSLDFAIQLEEIMGVMTAILEKIKEDEPKPKKGCSKRGRPKKEKKVTTFGELSESGFFDN